LLGSLRYNLDPFNKHTDLEIWEALDRAQLKNDIIQKFPDNLNHIVSERGENISVGQKQLLCIARALLRKPKVIIMDEVSYHIYIVNMNYYLIYIYILKATASVDSGTDKKIQDTIRQVFQHCTILTIAHRLESIADYDRIIVMSEGQVAEYASPYDLLQMETGIFRGLVDQLGSDVRTSFEKTALQRHLMSNTSE
jgi:ABC-type multidrug transport system fused ATPase/permease subunit